MLPNDNVSMSIGDHVLIVYSLMEHVTWKSPGPMSGWVGRILHPDSCTSVFSWSKVPLLFTWSVTVLLCRPLFPCPSRWHGSLPRHGLWWLADLWVTLLRHVSYTRNFFAKYADVKSKKYAKKYAQYYKICVLKYAELRNYKIYALKICGNAEYWKKYAR